MLSTPSNAMAGMLAAAACPFLLVQGCFAGVRFADIFQCTFTDDVLQVNRFADFLLGCAGALVSFSENGRPSASGRAEFRRFCGGRGLTGPGADCSDRLPQVFL